MSQRSQLRERRATTLIECRFCHRRDYVPTPGADLGKYRRGRPMCGGRLYLKLIHWEDAVEWPDMQIGADDTFAEIVRCVKCDAVDVEATTILAEERQALRLAQAEMAAHVTADHRACEIAERMREIESEAGRAMRRGELTDDDWQGHPLAVEWRALMREWWHLPAAATAEVYEHTDQQLPQHTGYQGVLPRPLSPTLDLPLTWKGMPALGAPWPKVPKCDGQWRWAPRYGMRADVGDVYCGHEVKVSYVNRQRGLHLAALGNYADALRAGLIGASGVRV